MKKESILSLAQWWTRIDVFTRSDYTILITESLNYCVKNKGLVVFAYCIMPSHVHLIEGCKEDAKLFATLKNLPVNELLI